MKRHWLGILCGVAVSLSAQGAITDDDAITAIVGESSNQNYSAMLGVACAIRNRGTLQGVYGLNNPVAHHATRKLRARAARAWLASAHRDTVAGCKYFGCRSDAPYFLNVLHFRPVTTIGAITFYKP